MWTYHYFNMFKWKRAPSYQEEGKGTEKLTLICTRTVPGLLWTLRSRSCPVLEEKKPTVNEAQEPSSWGGDWHKPGGISTWGLILTLASQALWWWEREGKSIKRAVGICKGQTVSLFSIPTERGMVPGSSWSSAVWGFLIQNTVIYSHF